MIKADFSFIDIDGNPSDALLFNPFSVGGINIGDSWFSRIITS